MKHFLPEGNYVITGGAGYLGSHAVKMLLATQPKAQIFVLDNLSKGHLSAIKAINRLKIGLKIKFIRADIGQPKKYEFIFKKQKIAAVLHFAGLIEVGESVKKPKKYFLNNVEKPQELLRVMLKYGCKNLIFSSSAAVYGKPKYLPIDENHPTRPANPYGQTKLAFEKNLKKSHQKFGLNFISFRYFNAAGADASGVIGENHQPETHLIPSILKAAVQKKSVKIFGKDYPTKDGTCIRDYIHVTDLIEAHLIGLKMLLNRKIKPGFFNLGTGRGHSNLEVVKTAQKVTGRKINLKIGARRAGDVPVLIASSQLAQKKLRWGQKLKSLNEIISSAWNWHKKSG